jgi:hypothetical protein
MEQISTTHDEPKLERVLTKISYVIKEVSLYLKFIFYRDFFNSMLCNISYAHTQCGNILQVIAAWKTKEDDDSLFTFYY